MVQMSSDVLSGGMTPENMTAMSAEWRGVKVKIIKAGWCDWSEYPHKKVERRVLEPGSTYINGFSFDEHMGVYVNLYFDHSAAHAEVKLDNITPAPYIDPVGKAADRVKRQAAQRKERRQ